MNVQSWMIKSWPTLEWYLPLETEPPKTFKHLCTRGREDASAANPRQGETVWLGQIMGHNAGLAWEWSEYRPGVVMLSDPNCIVSNIRFVNADGQALPPLAALATINRVVHGLRWQQAVCLAIRRDGAANSALPSPALAWRTEPGASWMRHAAHAQERAAA